MEKLKALHVDSAEYSCLKAIVLFTTGEFCSVNLEASSIRRDKDTRDSHNGRLLNAVVELQSSSNTSTSTMLSAIVRLCFIIKQCRHCDGARRKGLTVCALDKRKTLDVVRS